ncbi:AAA family ATPase [Planctomycetota bacterium]
MNIIEIRKRDRSTLQAELETAGAVFKGNSCNCPFHDDNRPSAGIFQDDSETWRFKCQSCGVSGDVWDIQARNEGKDIAEVLKTARRESAEKYGKPVSKPRSQTKVFATMEDLKAACPGIVEAVYTYTNPANNEPEMIVIRCQIESGKTFRQCRPCQGGFEMKAPSKPWPIYNRGRILQGDTMVVVEGEKIVHALHIYGITATTSPAGAGKAEYADWTPLAGKNIVLWPDNDETGQKHMQQVERILQKLEPAPRISVIEPSDLDLQEKEDAADFLRQLETIGVNVRSELYRVLQQAKSRGVTVGVSERLEAIISGQLQAVSLPWRNLSRLTNAVIPGTVTLICGSPGASKSFMLLQALSFWQGNNIKACVYELEEDREFHLMRALAQRSGITGVTNYNWISRNAELARQTFSDNEQFLESLGRCIWASPDTQPTLEQLAGWSKVRAKAGYRVICIDPITAAVQTGKPWIVDNSFLQQIKRMATDYSCSVLLVTHPTKAINRPDMTALAGSAAYSRFAQTILWLQNHKLKKSKTKTACGTPETQHNRTVHILKARNGKGHGMKIACEFDSETLKLKEFGLITK